jgi:hypothetical protein
MFRVPSISGLFKWRQFEPEVILLAVGWYLRFSLSYRDVEESLAELGLHADHVTVWRWVQRYASEIQRRLRPRLQPTNDSWRGGRDLHPGQGQVALPVSCGGFFRRDPRLSPLGQAGRGRSKALSDQSARQSKPSDAASHQHRQACRLPAGDCATQRRGCSRGELPTSTGAISQQCTGTRSRGHQAPDPRQSTFQVFLGRLAHNCRLRGDPYDPQRPSVVECEGRSTAPLHSRAVRGELNRRSSIIHADFRLDYILATLRPWVSKQTGGSQMFCRQFIISHCKK